LSAGVVAISAVGLVIGLAEESSLASRGPVADSTSVNFLQPGGGGGVQGAARLHYEAGGESVAIANGGQVPLGQDFQVAVTTNPYPPASFDIEVDLYVTTLDGTPVVDAEVVSVWDMVVMWHGPFETRYTNLGNGHYLASFDMFMFGPWELVTYFSVPSQSESIPITLSIYTWPE